MELLVITGTFICLFSIVTSAAPDTLRIVNVLYRHGDRSPVTIYPKDPHQKDAWPQGMGWLSTTGMQQQYALGQYLRSEFGGLISADYKRTEILVQSSNEDRCLMSAYCNLAGLFPPSGDQVWNENLIWQPIPVHTRPQEEDKELNMGAPCPRYDALYEQELQSPAVKAEEKENADFYDLIEENTGVKKENISEVWKIADTLLCEKKHNMSMPPWLTDAIDNKLRSLQDWSFDLLFNGTELSKLKGGPLLAEMISNMKQVVAGNLTYKMYMYSAHDSTIAAVSQAMQVFNQKSPPYASAVFVELHDISGTYSVRIRYRNNTAEPPYVLMHPECQMEYCSLEKFVEVTEDRIPDDWDKECNAKVKNPAAVATMWSGTVVALVILGSVMLVLLVSMTVAWWRNRRIVRNFEQLP